MLHFQLPRDYCTDSTLGQLILALHNLSLICCRSRTLKVNVHTAVRVARQGRLKPGGDSLTRRLPLKESRYCQQAAKMRLYISCPDVARQPIEDAD
uniref:Transposase n=1 Tax=Panagrellus redivivus TaxID=6233 RepID=A0A7E4VSU8_PANRE